MDMFGDELSDSGETPSSSSERPKNCGVLSFHNGTELALLLEVERRAKQTAESVLAVIDEFCYSRHWMMHIGERKGAALAQEIEDTVSRKERVVCVELGTSHYPYNTNLPYSYKLTFYE